jgi:hypothetical protein
MELSGCKKTPKPHLRPLPGFRASRALSQPALWATERLSIDAVNQRIKKYLIVKARRQIYMAL